MKKREERYIDEYGVEFSEDKSILIKAPKSLKEYIIPDKVKIIGELSFFGCQDLRIINIPNSVIGIEFCAFALCCNLDNFTLPSSIQYVEKSAFLYSYIDLNDLVQRFLKQKNDVYEIPPYEPCLIDKIAGFFGIKTYFDESDFTTSIKVVPAKIDKLPYQTEEVLRSFGRYWYDKHEVKLDKFRPILSIGSSLIREYTMLDFYTEIENDAFKNCTKLERINFSKKLEKIGGCSFMGCTSLEKIQIPETVKCLGYNAFVYCKSLHTIENYSNIPINLKYFRGCVSLKKIILPMIDVSIECDKSGIPHITSQRISENTIIKDYVNFD